MSSKEYDDIESYLRLDHNDPLSLVEDVARVWGEAQVRYSPVRWYANSDSTCRDAPSSVQWQSTDEVNEERMRSLWVSACEGAMDDMVDPLERAVIWQTYANSVGPSVWRNGRLKGMRREEIKALLRRALNSLAVLLRRRGVGV